MWSSLQQAGGQWRPSGLFRPFSRITGDRVLGRQLHCFPVREERAFPVRIIARLLLHVVAARNEQRQEEQRSRRTTSSMLSGCKRSRKARLSETESSAVAGMNRSEERRV